MLNLSWPISESIKASEIKTSMLFDLVFAKNTKILLLKVLLFCFLIIDLYFLIPTALTQIFHPFAELVILIGIPTKEAKKEMKMHLVTVETKTSSCSI